MVGDAMIEAFKIAYHSSAHESDDIYGFDERKAIRDGLTAALAQGVGVAVRELAWEEVDENWWAAQSEELYLGYEVRITDSSTVRIRMPAQKWAVFEGTADQARSMMQADFEARIRSALVASPVQAVAYVSAEQLEALPPDREEGGAGYLPVRHTPNGKFQMALYASPVQEGWRARPLDEWHEDFGFAVWWTLEDGRWLGEPSYIGSPLCDDWPEYHTHWTPHPPFPPLPADKEGGR